MRQGQKKAARCSRSGPCKSTEMDVVGIGRPSRLFTALMALFFGPLCPVTAGMARAVAVVGTAAAPAGFVEEQSAAARRCDGRQASAIYRSPSRVAPLKRRTRRADRPNA